MNSIQEALGVLIAAVRVAHDKGGAYTLEESHHICEAIYYLDSLKNFKDDKESDIPAKKTKETQR